jgi:hypothetical protein
MADAPASSSSSSKSLMWMSVALFGGMAVLLGGGLFLAGRVVRSVGMSASAGPNVVRTPAGGLRVEREKEVGPGIPMYPHASLVIPGDREAAQAAKDAENSTTRVIYLTTDPRDLVDQWYQDHLAKDFQRHEAGETPQPDVFRDARVSGDDITFLAERENHTRIVALTMDAAGTRITLIRIDKPSAEDSGQPGQP